MRFEIVPGKFYMEIDRTHTILVKTRDMSYSIFSAPYEVVACKQDEQGAEETLLSRSTSKSDAELKKG